MPVSGGRDTTRSLHSAQVRVKSLSRLRAPATWLPVALQGLARTGALVSVFTTLSRPSLLSLLSVRDHLTQSLLTDWAARTNHAPPAGADQALAQM